MVNMMLRNLHDEVHDRLRAQAAANGRSLGVEMRPILVQSVIASSASGCESGPRQDRLEAAVGAILDEDFAGRILPYDRAASPSIQRTDRSPPLRFRTPPRSQPGTACRSKPSASRSSIHGGLRGRTTFVSRAYRMADCQELLPNPTRLFSTSATNSVIDMSS